MQKVYYDAEELAALVNQAQIIDQAMQLILGE